MRAAVLSDPEPVVDLLIRPARVFLDKASGKLARRPDWDRLSEQLRAGDQVVVTRLSRLARSVRHLTELTAGLQEGRVDLVVLRQGIDTSTSAGLDQAMVGQGEPGDVCTGLLEAVPIPRSGTPPGQSTAGPGRRAGRAVPVSPGS